MVADVAQQSWREQRVEALRRPRARTGRFVALGLVATLSVMPSCYMTRVHSGVSVNRDERPTKFTAWSFFWGLTGDDIPAGNTNGLARVDVYVNPLLQLIAVLTVGLVYPTSVRVWYVPAPASSGWTTGPATQPNNVVVAPVVVGGQQQYGSQFVHGPNQAQASAHSCGSCGIEVGSTARFCHACGDPVVIPGTRTFCESCGDRIEGAAFCPRCGTKR